jgi:hypothetical protein
MEMAKNVLMAPMQTIHSFTMFFIILIVLKYFYKFLALLRVASQSCSAYKYRYSSSGAFPKKEVVSNGVAHNNYL